MVLTIIELSFLAAGLWSAILGKVPSRLFSVLFGKGQYELPPLPARLFGLLLATPFPAALTAGFLLGGLLGSSGLGYALILEVLYTLAIAIAATIIARKIRRPEINPIGISSMESMPGRKTTMSYGLRLLTMVGLIILALVTCVSGGALIITLLSGAVFAAPGTRDFWMDIFAFSLMITIAGAGLFGTLRLVRVLRN